MAELVPEGFSMTSLANDAERDVVSALARRLSDSWLVLPSVGLRSIDRDHEVDVVLVNQEFGVIALEVKSHQVAVDRGEWCFGPDRRSFDKAPSKQASENAYALRDHLRGYIPSLPKLHVNWGVVFPNTTSISGTLPPDVRREQILLAADVEDPLDAIEVIGTLGHTIHKLTAEDVEAVVSTLCPDVEFAWDPTARMARARRALDDLSAAQVQVLAELDMNPRVVATGEAGTGKTRLAVAWARRTRARGERALLTCYNEPLSERLADLLQADEDLQVGPFLRLALTLEGMPALDGPPPGAEAEFDWWTRVVPGHLRVNWHRVSERFDTIVVDEAQDFDPEWIDLLEQLLDPDGANRLLLVGDEKQPIYSRGFEAPSVHEGWTHCRLVSNCRNARQIALLLRRKLGGAPAPGAAPDATDLRFVVADLNPGTNPDTDTHTASVADAAAADGPDTDTDSAAAQGPDTDTDPATAHGPSSDTAHLSSLADAVDSEIDRLIGEERDPTEVMVLTLSSRLRDHLTAELSLSRWEQRADGIVCETVHRLKGLEADTVILVADTPDPPDHLLYVGISRAVNELILIGPEGLGLRLGLTY